jgi:hypothetical protein
VRAEILLALGFAAGTALASGRAAIREAGVVIVCQGGGVGRVPDEGLLGSASSCVGHDRKGGTFSAASISIYDDGFGP